MIKPEETNSEIEDTTPKTNTREFRMVVDEKLAQLLQDNVTE